MTIAKNTTPLEIIQEVVRRIDAALAAEARKDIAGGDVE